MKKKRKPGIPKACRYFLHLRKITLKDGEGLYERVASELDSVKIPRIGNEGDVKFAQRIMADYVRQVPEWF